MNHLLEVHLPTLWRVARKNGWTAYLVGGFPRDQILGISSDEADVVALEGRGVDLARAFAAEVGGGQPMIFPRFGTAHFRTPNGALFEFVSARSERYTQDTRKPEVATAEIAADVWRRDFTVNTLLLDADNKLIDLTGMGISDLNAKVLRTPSDPASAFDEDPLRMLRAARFVAQLGLLPADGLALAISRKAERIKPPVVSVERVTEELKRLLRARHPEPGLRLAMDTGILGQLIPELESCRGIGIGGYHDRDVWEHTVAVVDGSPADLVTRLAALLHDIAKPVTQDPLGQRPLFKDHERVGAQMAEAIVHRLRFSTDECRRVRRLVELHLRPVFLEPSAKDAAVRRLMRAADEDLGRLMDLAQADIEASAYPDIDKTRRLRARMEELGQQRVRQLACPLNGHELMGLAGLPAGPWIHRAKQAILEAIIEDEIGDTKADALTYLSSHPELLESR